MGPKAGDKTNMKDYLTPILAISLVAVLVIIMAYYASVKTREDRDDDDLDKDL